MGGELNISLLKWMLRHPRSCDFKYEVLSRSNPLYRVKR